VSSEIKQPLVLGKVLVIHVPLCGPHSKQWEAFASHLRESLDQSARQKRDANWLLESAMALGLFPPGEPL
jgi:hypothetical protein